MDYVLYTYGFVGFAALYAAAWTAGGQKARQVLSLGAYAFHPAYVPPSRSWRRDQIRHRARVRANDFPSWHAHFADAAAEQPGSATPGIDAAPTVALPTFVHAEMSADGSDTGVEHWGDLLRDMNTEEREIHSAELLETYYATKAHEHIFLDGLDEAVDRFAAAMTELEGRHAAVYAGTWHNLTERHGGADRWSTGQYKLYDSAPAAA